MRTTAAVFLAVASLASANLYVTEPVASTICSANVNCVITWNDDGTTPALGTIGPCSIALYTGGMQQQTFLQSISPSTDVSQVATVSYLPDPTVGPDGAFYFIKYTSLSYMDPTNPTYPYTAYSSKFTLNGMTGTFNASVEAQISGAASATSAAVGATTVAAVGTTTAANTMATVVTTKITSSASASTAKSSSTAKTNAAFGTMAIPGVVSSIAGVTVIVGLASVLLGMVALGL
jgi:hypothetical protein